MLWQVITAANIAIAAAYFGVRGRQALEINDNIVQGLAVAKMALENGDDRDTRIAIEDTLRRSQTLISDLRRTAPAGVSMSAGGT